MTETDTSEGASDTDLQEPEEPSIDADDEGDNEATIPDVEELPDEELQAVADEVAEETTEEEEGDSQTNDQDSESGQQSAESPMEMAAAVDESGTDLGHVYCKTLGLGAATLVDRYDDNAKNRDQLIDEYAHLAKQLDIDQYMNEWWEQFGDGGDLPPGKALVMFTGLFAVSVAATNEDVFNGVLDDLEGLGGNR